MVCHGYTKGKQGDYYSNPKNLLNPRPMRSQRKKPAEPKEEAEEEEAPNPMPENPLDLFPQPYFFFPHALFCMVDLQDGGNESNAEVSKREKARLRRMELMKKQKIQEILDAQNAAVDADMNNKGKGRLQYLLQQTELFAHFAKGDPSASQKKVIGQ